MGQQENGLPLVVHVEDDANGSPRKYGGSRTRYHRHHGYAHPEMFNPLEPEYGEQDGCGNNSLEAQQAAAAAAFQLPAGGRPEDYLGRQYSPRHDWPPPMGNWMEGRNVTAAANWPSAAEHQRYMSGSHVKWLDQQRPGSSLSVGNGSGVNNGGGGKKYSGGSTGTVSSPLSSTDIIPDETLAHLTVKELNKRVQNFPREDVVALKQRRRTLKNRG